MADPRKPLTLVQRKRFLVMVSEALTVDAAKALLEERGFAVDPAYAPVVVDPSSGRFVLRGRASSETIGALAKEKGLEFFPDIEVQGAR